MPPQQQQPQPPIAFGVDPCLPPPSSAMSPQSDELMSVVTDTMMSCSHVVAKDENDTVCAVSPATTTQQQPQQSVTSLAEDQRLLEDLRDVVQALKAQEALYNAPSDKLPLFFDSWRPVMVSWMYSVIDTFALNEICVPTGLYFLDTCSHLLASSNACNKAKELYPLMALTSLNLAVKCHETRMFPLDQLVQLMGGKNKSTSRNSMRYTPDDVIRMEKTLLQGCRWKLHPATAIDFLHQFVLVLEEDGTVRQNVLQRGLLHLKHASMWEHVLHQQQLQSCEQPPRSFLPSTMAYASLLLAMEDLRVPLPDKQACCLALLQVGDLSTHTPFLSKAYNWLVYAQQLQQQLVQANQKVATPPTETPAPAVVSPTAIATVSTGPQATKADFQPPNGQLRKPESQSAIVSPAASTATTKTMDTSTTISNSMSMQDSSLQQSESQDDLEEHPDDESDEDGDDDDLSDSEVIFYSHTYTGDGFEVMAVEFDDEGDIVPCKMDTFSLTSPSGPEGVPPELILTQSLDEDGFEVSYSLVRGSIKAVEQLSNMLASPRDVIA